MIRIKDYIFNENDIKVIENDEDLLTIIFKDGSHRETQGTFEDIEWNYGTPQETQRKMQKELCKSCYYRDTISNKLKELEEKYDKALTKLAHESHKRIELEEENKKMNELVQFNVKTTSVLTKRINKALKFIDGMFDDGDGYKIIDNLLKLEKILKGEE